MSHPETFPGLPWPAMINVDTAAGAGATRLEWESPVDPRVAARLQQLDAPLGEVRVRIGQIDAGPPRLDADESYTLTLNTNGVLLAAASTWGALHGVSTLQQLCVAGSLPEQGYHIEDEPRFAWRGLLIDCARHFIPLSHLSAVVDGMARLKMNVLHLHLTDDQAFRFPSAAFPELVSKDAYTRAELEHLVAYAADRGVRVVAEIDVPGHVQSWLVARPDWGLGQVPPTHRFGVHKACLNPTSEAVYEALTTLFGEVVSVFPDEYVHIGGDEVHPAWWSEDGEVQAFIAAHSLGDVRGLQAYFNRRLHQILSDLGKQVIGWDEVLHDVMPALTVQNWRGATTRDRALARGLDCIVSAGFYLDLFYPADLHYRYDIALPQADLLAVEDAWRADPRLAHVAEGIAWTDRWRAEAVDAQHLPGRLLGGEACLWSELVDADTLATRLWSRLPAVAERLWSPRGVADSNDFYRRLEPLLQQQPFALEARQREQLHRLGLTSSQVDAALYLEPVKWYARLLGDQALQARLGGSEMPQARPYDSRTPLNRVVDFIAPESLSARALTAASDEEVEARAMSWQTLVPGDWPADAQEAVAGLRKLGKLLLAHLREGVGIETELERLYVPRGEYMLAPVPPLLVWLAGRR